MGYKQTVHVNGSFKFEVRSEKNHKRPHLHVVSPDGDCSISLDDLSVLAARGFTERAVNKVIRYIENNDLKNQALEVWYEINK